MKQLLFKNWKTTLGGLVTAALTLLLGFHKIDATQYGMLLGAATSVGLAVSKDGDVSGTGKDGQ